MSKGFHDCLTSLQKKHIQIQNDWLEACINWIIEENGNKSAGELCNLVYEQWLMADLCEIAEPSLPKNVHKIKGFFSGNFCVQVMSVIDIGHSAYSQLQKHKGESLDYNDAEEDEDQEENEAKEFFKKSAEGTKTTGNAKNKWNQPLQSRMLHLNLHDGVQTIEAIEYSPIKKILLESIEPGCKLLLSGRIQCRDQILLLRQENVEILGGNVESLMESHSQVKSITTKLKIESEASGTIQKRPNQNVRNNPEPSINITKSSTALKQQVKTQSSSRNSLEKKTTNIINNKVGTKKLSSLNSTSKPGSSAQKEDYFDDFDDDFLKDLDEEDFSRKLDDDKDDIFFQDVDTKHERADTNKQPSKSHHDNITTASSTKSRKPIEQYEDIRDDIGNFFDENEDVGDIFDMGNNIKKQSHSKGSIENNDTSENINHHHHQQQQQQQTRIKFSGAAKEGMTIKEITSSRDEPVYEAFNFKGYFKTLASKLNFQDGYYELFAVLADGNQFLKVLLRDKALYPVIGFTADQVKTAVSHRLPKDEKVKVKEALCGAEKALEMNKWNMKLEFNKNENIYEVVLMEPDYSF